MQVEGIIPGDIVRVSAGGRLFHAVVRGSVLGGLEVDPIERGVTLRRIRPRDVVDHWRHAPRTAASADREQRSFDDLLDR